MTKINPLLEPFETPPFSQIKNEDFKPAFEIALQQAREEINQIVENPERPSFKNTLEAMEFAGEKLGKISSIFFNLNSAETNPEIQKIAQEVSPWLTEFQNDIILNQQLFKRIKQVFLDKENLQLTAEQNTLLEKTYKSFTRNGANLSEEKKKKLRDLDTRLAKLSLEFGENVLAETNAYELHIINEEDLEGLPESEIETAAQLAKTKDKEGYIFTLHYPSYLPFMKYIKNRDLRKKMALAQGKKGFQDNQYNNEKIVLEITQLRFERAQLLGYKNHADFVLQERMAKSPEQVEIFLNDLLEKAKPAAEKEFQELEAFAKELDGIDQLQIWDAAYYSEKLKKEKFDLDDEKLKPYFPLENVIGGVFKVSERLFGLTFEEVFDIDTYHKEVRTYQVYDEQKNIKALLYADFHPREGKRNGAWMTSFKGQQIKNGKNERPQISIVCNFSRPTSNTPALLTFNEVTTLFHEFGHALHGILADTTYKSLSGTNVYWDFVELPSQLLENWCYEEEALSLFAKHYQTGEMIPMEIVERIKKASNFLEGMQTVRQLSFGILDMSWHAIDPRTIKNVKTHEKEAFRSTQLYLDVAENCMSTSFSHIFQGGYSAGYYSYKWAEVLDADAFAYFREKGIFNKTIADKFKEHVLSKGGTEDPMILYKRFRGKEPDNEALLKRAGLIETD